MGIAKKYLSEIERKNIAKDLFKITSIEEKKGELHGLCPIHQESNPSFSYNFQKDKYNCFSCGAAGDIIKLWTEVNSLSQTEGFKAFCEKFGLPLGGDHKEAGAAAKGAGGEGDDLASHEKAVEQMHRAWELFTPLPEAWISRLKKTRGWSRKWIDILDLRLETYRMKKSGDLIKLKNPEKIAIPVRDIRGNLVNIRLYHEGAKEYKIISFARSTGSSRLFPAKPFFDRGTNSISTIDDVPVLLCEGESDTICALSHGFNAITQTSKLKNWPDEHLEQFRGRDVVIAYDADEPGQKYARFAAQALTGVAKSIRMIQWPSFMGIDESGAIPAKGGKDLTDFFVRHGKAVSDFQNLIDEAVSPAPDVSKMLSDDAGNVIDVREFFNFGINNRYSFRPRLLAERIISEIPLLSDPETGLTYCWNGKYWEIYNEDHLRKRAIMYLGSESQRDRIQDAIFQVKMLSTLPHGRQVNDKIDWVCLQNCMLNLYTDEIRPHDPEFYFTNILPVEFNPDSEKRCDRFEKFLETNIKTPEAIAQLQEFTGYCMVRHADYQKCLFLLGPGADGKTKYMEILNELIGGDNCAAVSLSEIDDHFQRSALYNKMVNISGEVGSNFIDTEYFKKITTGDKINAAFKHKDAFDFKPFCKLIFAGNILPRVKDNSDGYFRRILPISFKRQFLEDDPERDPHLLTKLKAEISEIFYWAWCGLKRLAKQGRFTDCEETRELLLGYRRSNNPILCFVEDELKMGSGDEYSVEKTALYESYKVYCKGGGYLPLGKENFYRELYAAVKTINVYRPRKDNPERKEKIRGMRFKTEEELKTEKESEE